MTKLFFSYTSVSLQNAVPTSLPPGLKVIEKIISPEEERRMLESIDWKGDEDTQNGGYNYRNPDILYFYAGFFLQFRVTGSLHLGKCIVRNYSVFVLSILEIGSYPASYKLLG